MRPGSELSVAAPVCVPSKAFAGTARFPRAAVVAGGEGARRYAAGVEGRELERIRSRAHPLLKRVRAVRAGREAGVCVLEGERLVLDALGSGLAVEVLLVAEGRRVPEGLRGGEVRVRYADADVLASVSALTTSPGILALAQAPPLLALGGLDPGPGALLALVAGVADPGNLGAIARAAEAAGACGLGLLGAGANPAGERALRGSMGSLLRLPLYRVESAEQPAERGLRPVVAATRGGVDPRHFDWSGPIALWLPGETGEAPVPRDAERVSLPMAGGVESLNVAVAAAVLLYAAGRV